MKLLLSTICIALLALFGYQVMSYILGDENSHIPSIGKDLEKSIDFDLPLLAVLNGIEEYSEIVQRPLFIKDRVPAAASAQTVNEVTSIDELRHLILIGTASSSDVQIAIIEDTKAKQMKRLKVGESYNKWSVTEVSSDHVIFQNAELEYKLFISPIKGSQKDKQAKLLGQLNKSKIVKGTAASKNNASIDELNENGVGEETKQKATGKIWNYKKKSNQDNVEKNYKPTKKSPIKIPFENEKDAAYYEGLENEENPSASDDRGGTTSEVSLEDYYDDEDITEAELKEMQGLGLKILDD